MKAGALLFAALELLVLFAAAGCRQYPDIQWQCDFDVMVARPLAEQDATPEEGGALAASVCGETCGPPAQSCTFTLLDGGTPGAVCPLCTF
jgi:hypothetical protein